MVIPAGVSVCDALRTEPGMALLWFHQHYYLLLFIIMYSPLGT